MNAIALIKGLLEDDEFDPAAEVDRLTGPVSIGQVCRWLDAQGIVDYRFSPYARTGKNYQQVSAFAMGTHEEVEAKAASVVRRFGHNSGVLSEIDSAGPSQNIRRALSILIPSQNLRDDLRESVPFDPTDEVDRLVAPQEVFSDPNIKVVIPRTFQSLYQLTSNGGAYVSIPSNEPKGMPITISHVEAFNNFVKKNGPFYVALDTAHPNESGNRGVVMHFGTGWVGNAENCQALKWKDVPKHISPEALQSLQQGLGDYFVAEGKRKGKTRLAVLALTRLGRYEDAGKFGRHAARMKGVPLGQSLAVAQARGQAKLRTNNRFSRLLKSQSPNEVKFGKNGCWLLFSDWDGLTPFFDKGCRKTAEKVFNNDLEFHDVDDGSTVKEIFSNVNDANEHIIKQLLIGRNVESDDFVPPITEEDVSTMGSKELEGILTNEANEGEVEDIVSALQQASRWTTSSSYETAYWSAFTKAVQSAFGNDENGEAEDQWIKVKQADGVEKSKLGFYASYEKLQEWLDAWREDEGYDYYDDIYSLALKYVEPIDVDTDHIRVDWDADYFNQQLGETLSEIDMQPFPDKSDPAQPEFPWEDPRGEREMNAHTTVNVDPPEGEAGDTQRYKHVDSREATRYQKVMGDKRVRFTSESMALVAALLEDDVTDFVDNHFTGEQFVLVSFEKGVPCFYHEGPAGVWYGWTDGVKGHYKAELEQAHVMNYADAQLALQKVLKEYPDAKIVRKGEV